MSDRHRSREVAFQILYEVDAAGELAGLERDAAGKPTLRALAAAVDQHFEHFEVQPHVREFAARVAAGTLNELAEIDAKIAAAARNWSMERMGIVDRNLLRIAVYEIWRCPDVPASVAMDEAIELAKKYGNEGTAAFINGILDTLAKELRPS